MRSDNVGTPCGELNQDWRGALGGGVLCFHTVLYLSVCAARMSVTKFTNPLLLILLNYLFLLHLSYCLL